MWVTAEGGARISRGIAVDLRVGESITLTPGGGGPPIVLTVESKTGQRSRVRIQAETDVQIGRPVKKVPVPG